MSKLLNNTELDAFLCSTYPKIFRDRRASPQKTLMCWGLEIGDGWGNILSALCFNIQNHIDFSRKERANALHFNRALHRALKYGDQKGLLWYFSNHKGEVTTFSIENTTESISRGLMRELPKAAAQVVAMQIKEKFGSLRFYYSGGDEVISGMVRMAESMSSYTCEECGAPGHLRTGGWVRTLCDEHTDPDIYDDEGDI